MAKRIIRLTESELMNVIKASVNKILMEDVLGNDWHENEDNVLNNYEAFDDQEQMYRDEAEMDNEHNWGIKGEEGLDPTHYDNFSDDIINGAPIKY